MGDGLQYNTGVVLQTFPLADLPPWKVCNIEDLPPDDLQQF